MLAIKAVLTVLFNLIIYYAMGNLLVSKKESNVSPVIKTGVGFFIYYGLFSIVCVPVMFTYWPLSTLTRIWMIVVGVLVLLAIALKGKTILSDIENIRKFPSDNILYLVIIGMMIVLQLVTILMSYDFTLDAAYYVANVSTCVDTNMINIYDPFTGAWQDHFELRYAFATYSINDAIMCQITKLPALIQTKSVMSATVIIMVNMVYVGIADALFKGNIKKMTIMMAVVTWINYTYITIYTASNFLMTRTYEGKAIVGNLALMLIFLLFIKISWDDAPTHSWIMLFAISFGSASISSSANMLVPAEMSVLFVPYILKNKKWNLIVRYLILLLPGIIMMLEYVLYVKGYFSIYTYKWNQ